MIAKAKSLPGGHRGCSIESWPDCSREHRERKTFKHFGDGQLTPGRGSENDGQLNGTDAEVPGATVPEGIEVLEKKLV